MLGSFIKHGLDQRTAEAESILQVYAPPFLPSSPFPSPFSIVTM